MENNKENRKGKALAALLLFLKDAKNLPLIASLIGGAAVITTGTILLAPRPNTSSSQSSLPTSSEPTSSASSLISSAPSSTVSSETVNTWTVTFDAQGGTAVAEETIEQGSLITAPTSFFGLMNLTGWYTSNDGGETIEDLWDFAQDTVTGDLTLYAQWEVPFMTDYETIVSQSEHLLALDGEGSLWGWGNNGYGQLGIGSRNDRIFPTRTDLSFLQDRESILHISTDNVHTVILTNQGRVFGMGDHATWSMGVDEITPDYLTPTELTIPLAFEDETILNVWAGSYTTWVLTSYGRLLVTGENYSDETGVVTGDLDFVMGFTEVPMVNFLAGEVVVDFTEGDYGYFAITNLGNVYSWGNNWSGRLGLGVEEGTVTTPTLMQFANLNENEFVTDVSLYGDTVVALTNQYRVYGWGETDDGELAPSEFDLDPYFSPTLIDLSFLNDNDKVVLVQAGRDHTLFQTEAGLIYQVGDNSDRQLGTGDNQDTLVPLLLDLSALQANETIIEIRTADDITLFRTNQNRWYGIGDNSNNFIYFSDMIEEYSQIIEIQRVGLEKNERFTQLRLGENHTIGLTSDHRVFAWGNNGLGQLAIDAGISGMFVPQEIEFPLSDGETITNIYVLANTNFALTSNGRLLGWGRNENGEFGMGTTENAFSPVLLNYPQLNNGESITDLYLDYSNNYILTSTGRLLGWGQGLNILGVGEIVEPYLVPTEITIPALQLGETIETMFIANLVRFVLTSTGRVFAWGNNSNYGLGIAVENDLSSPTLVTFAALNPGEKITSIAYNIGNALAMTSDNRIFGWGNNIIDQLSTGDESLKINISTPTLLDMQGIVDNTIRRIYANQNGTFYFFTTDQLLYTSGNNGNGQLGVGTTADMYGAVVLIDSFTISLEDSLLMMTMDGYSTMLLTEDGRILVWAIDSFGKFLTFDNSNDQYTLPYEVGF